MGDPPQGLRGTGKATLSQAWPCKAERSLGCSWGLRGDFGETRINKEGPGQEDGPGFQELESWGCSEFQALEKVSFIILSICPFIHLANIRLLPSRVLVAQLRPLTS